MFPNRIKGFRSAGVTLALLFAWSGETFAKPPKPPSAAKSGAAAKAPTARHAESKGVTNLNGGTLIITGGGMGQFPATLDQALSLALESSPKVMAAKSRVTLAEAELTAARMDAAHRTVELWTERQTLQLKYQDILAENQRLHKANPTPLLIEAGAQLTQLEMELRCLIGQTSFTASRGGLSMTATSFERPAKPLQLPRGTVVQRTRDALLTNTEITFVNAPVEEVGEYLKDRHKINNIFVDSKALREVGGGHPLDITIDVRGVSLIAAFEAMEDLYPQLKIVVRDYGLLVTTPERAREEGYLPAVDFIRLGSNGGGPIGPLSPLPAEQAPKQESSNTNTQQPTPATPQPKPEYDPFR